MKKILLSVVIFFVSLTIAFIAVLYSQRDSKPAIICTSLDGSIRPRNYCLMNPFRDTRPENVAESILSELRNGNINVLAPYTTADSKFFENEKNFRIKSWRIGDSEIRDGELFVQYWVKRENYAFNHEGSDIEEEVTFWFDRKSDGENNGWKLSTFSAIY